MVNRLCPILYIVSPCYFSHDVLPKTGKLYRKTLQDLIDKGKISNQSKILFVNDGSTDDTWQIICDFANHDNHFIGINLSRNFGHQRALLAGLMEIKDQCDITISIDDDGQDDVNAMEKMVDAYRNNHCEIVYGVRSSRKTDTLFKRFTAESYYKILNALGAQVIFNHADYRMISSMVLKEFSKFKEVNLYLRGLIPMLGFQSTTVEYERKERIAGKSHYTLAKLLHLAFDGITSCSTKPIKLITIFGLFVSFTSFLGIIWAIFSKITQSNLISGWSSMVCIICFVSGVQLVSLGVIGEYIGKIYMEVKHRPRYIIQDKTETFQSKEPL